MNIIQWVRTELSLRRVTSDAALYEHMASQSGYSLPVIYQPFDGTKRSHWDDRGRILDFLAAVGEGDLLDFGPGDGWPSLLVAPYARSVTGVDASPRRIAVCEENARRLGLTNFRGAVYRVGEPLPFADGSFDGLMAASSIEQTPDPQATLRELCRVLRPGGRLRIFYESPALYAGGGEQELHVWALDEATTYLYAIDRDLPAERVTYYCLLLGAPLAAVHELLGKPPTLEPGAAALAQLRPWVRDAMTYDLRLPGCHTWLNWLKGAGFRTAAATHGGGRYAASLFEALDPAWRPVELTAVDALLRPGVQVVTGLAAPPEAESLITATK